MNKRVQNLAEFRQQMLENSGGLGFEFELTWDDNGNPRSEVFLVPHPMATTDAQDEAIQALEEKSAAPAMARILLNTPEDQSVYDRFVAAGGRAKDVFMAWQAMTMQMQTNGFALPK